MSALIALGAWAALLALLIVHLLRRAPAPADGVTLTKYELTALARAGEIIAGAFESGGCDLTDTELPDGTTGPAPLLSALMKLELAVVLAGEE